MDSATAGASRSSRARPEGLQAARGASGAAYCRATLRPKTRASSTTASAGEGYSGRLPLSLPPVRGEPGGSGEGCLLEERRRTMPDDPGFALEGEALLADCRERREPVQLCKREGVPARDVRALRRGALCNTNVYSLECQADQLLLGSWWASCANERPRAERRRGHAPKTAPISASFAKIGHQGLATAV